MEVGSKDAFIRIVRGGFRVGAITSREELLYIVYINEEVNV